MATGTPSRSYEIQASSHLTNWSLLAALMNSNANPPAPLTKPPVVSDPARPDTSAPLRATALGTGSCPRQQWPGLSRSGATTMDVAEQWVYAVLWLCCLYSLIYCFATLF